ncbi:MAG TPA: apolipoprotein N-acyltransferase [Pseudomonas sp.]|nr:apolipoprotein N-acyltransferase [Pseudomonas sp.]MBB49680.1 apolipoprotein N-acyltransferase [Pseudomonadales bacterium]MBF77756.1 apolipoprotein N-acyltransferase [Pseudomonadales bacterium]MBU32248.1 apolipoprotein N-acyltransferase [Pseudomonadales bacterium]HCA24528.1 apolipoprotein N-acyltransferase [Pseudomonas sp.]|tara:strand:+ start:3550 stop:5157 length:1608 start_codon:yes stop_codon:yes gene_type:complete
MAAVGKPELKYAAATSLCDQVRQRTLTRLLLALLSGAMLSLPWVDGGLYWSGWIGWVPLLFALHASSLRQAALLGWCCGTVFYIGTAYWMVDFAIHLKGLSLPVSLLLASLFWLYAGASLAVGCVLFRLISRRLPQLDLISFPLALVIACALYPTLFDLRFSETQAAFVLAIQGVDLVGAQGLDMLMLLTSALLFQWLQRDLGGLKGQLALGGSALVLIWFVYGWFALGHWDRQAAAWHTMRIGLVQPNDAPTRRIPAPPEGYSREYPEEMEATRRLSAAGARWVAWPEARYKGYFDQQSVRQAWADQMLGMSSDLFFHDVETRNRHATPVSYNTLGWLGQEGALVDQYRKMQRVPFGEYLPDFWTLPGINWLTTRFLGDYLREVGEGQEHVFFPIEGMRVVPKICYETAFPEFIAEAIGSDAGGKVLLFVSQDNWFGESSQPFQHRAMSIVRAVENRVPMLHLINNGPSVAALPSGRAIAGTPAFSRAEMLVDLPYSPTSGGSFFTRHAQHLNWFWYTALAVLLGCALWPRRRR